MTVISYVRLLSLLETTSENTKAIRMWALKLNDELVDVSLQNPTKENSEFLRTMGPQKHLRY